MKKLIFTIFVVCSALFVHAQTLLIDPTQGGGFELGSTPVANGWTEVNPSTDGWAIGAVPVPTAGSNCAYISNDGGISWKYSQFSVYSHLYQDFVVPAGLSKMTLGFKWKGYGEGTTSSNFDNMKVYLVPVSYTPSSSSEITGQELSGPSSINGMYKLDSVNWNSETIEFSAVPGNSYRLVFRWKSDGSTIGNPPIALDEVSLTASAPGNFITINSGNWNDPAIWQGNAVPGPADNALVSAGDVVDLNASGLSIGNLTIDGTLGYTSTPADFTVNGNLQVNAGGILNVFNSTTGKRIYVANNIINNGVIDLSIGSTSAGNLTLNGGGVQSVSGSGSFANGKIRNLTITNTSLAIPNIIWDFPGVSVEYGLSISNAKIDLNGHTFTYGTSITTAGNTFTFTNGGFMNGTFARWWTNTATGYTTLRPTSAPTGAAGRYPFYNPAGDMRIFYLGRKTPTVGGIYAVEYIDANTTTSGLNIVDGAYTITDRWDAHFNVNTGSTNPVADSNFVTIIAPNSIPTAAPGAYVSLQSSAISGFHLNTYANLAAQRRGVSTSDLLDVNGIYIGLNALDVSVSPIASGDWNSPATWPGGILPTCSSNVNIPTGIVVSVSSAGNFAKSVNIAAGGSLTLTSGDLTVGCVNNDNMFVNNGTLSVGPTATLNINGYMTHNSGSTFNQTGGDIFVDGNSGTALNSVPSGLSIVSIYTSQLNWTAGTLTIVDPHASTSTSSNSFLYSLPSGNHIDLTSGSHTLKFGDGVSTDPGGHSNGFRLNTYASSSRISLYNLVVDGGSGTNRFVTTVYTFGVNNDLSITANSEARFTSTVYISGNFINNGTYTSTSTTYLGSLLGGTVGGSSLPQNVSGSGLFRNSATTPTANLTSFTINNQNPAGVTLSVPLVVSGTLNLTDGVVYTSGSSLLSLGAGTGTGTLSGGGANAYVNGPFERTISATNGNGTYQFFPVGKSGYAPIWLAPANSMLSKYAVESFDSNTGTATATISVLSSTRRWEVSLSTGAFSTMNMRLGDAGIAGGQTLVQANAAAGVYDVFVGYNATFNGSATPPTLQSQTPVDFADFTGYVSYATPATCAGIPSPGNTIASASNICLGESVTLSIQNATLGLGVKYQWQVSTDGITYSNLVGDSAAVLQVSPAGLEYYRCKVLCTYGPDSAYTIPFQATYVNSILSSVPATRCGAGSVTLSATANPGASIQWLVNANDIAAVGTGLSFTTTVISDTVFYAQAYAISAGSATYGNGAINSTSVGESYFPGAWGGAKTQNIFTAAELAAGGLSAGPITAMSFFANTSGQVYDGFRVYMGHTTQNTATSTFINSGLDLVYVGTQPDSGFTPVAGATNTLVFGTGGTTPAFIWDGTSNIVVTVSWSSVPSAYTSTASNLQVDNLGWTATTATRADGQTPSQMFGYSSGSTYNYRPRISFHGDVVCKSAPEPVAVTLSVPPAFALSASIDTICVGATTTTPITITTGASDYDTYAWDQAGVSGDELNGWTFNPTTTTTYLLTATQSSGLLCGNVAQVTIEVDQFIPDSPTATATSYDLCLDATTQILSVQSATGSSPLTVSSGPLGIAIPDSDPIGISNTLVVSSIPNGATITQIDVLFNATHTWSGDIDLYLTGANGTQIELTTDNGGSGDNYVNTLFSSAATNSITTGTAPFTGTFLPEGDLSSLFSTGNGNWTLQVSDDGTGDLGTLNDWTLSIYYTLPVITTHWYDQATGGTELGTGTTLESVGTIVLPSPAPVGVYDFYADHISGKCSALNRTQITVTVHDLPVVNAGNDTSVCENNALPLNATGADNYVWDNGVSNGSTFIPTVTDTIYVIGTDLNGCSNSDSIIVSLLTNPIVDAGVDVTECEGETVTLSASGADSYVWNNGVTDGVSFIPTLGGYYTVVGTALNGCFAADSLLLTLNTLPSITAGNDTAVCEGSTVFLHAVTPLNSSISWDNGVLDSVGFVPAATLVYTVTATDTITTCVNTDQVQITVNSNPTVDLGLDITTPNQDYTIDAPLGFDAYAWSTGATTPSITVNQSGSYSVTVTDNNGCTASDTVVFVTTFSIENADGSKGEIKVFPNPTKDIVTLHFQSVNANDILVDVLDVSGAVLSAQELNLNAGAGNMTISLAHLAEGVYFVRIQFNNTQHVQRIVLKK